MFDREFPRGGFVVVPSDVVELQTPTAGAGMVTGFYTNGAGNVTILTETGDLLTIGCNLGTQFFMRIRKIMATGTTCAAGSIFATY